MNFKFKVETDHPGAFESKDHLEPVGSINDNYTNLELLKEVCKYFGEEISILDLGCAGGQFVSDFVEYGNIGVGLEGSSNVLNGPGRKNWLNEEQNLFLCDITKPFKIKYSDLYKFNFIHCSEVMEHINENDLDVFLSNVYNHLSDDGVFCTQISIDDKDPLHVSVFNKEKWIDILLKNNFVPCDGLNNSHHIGYIFNTRFRDHIVMNSDGSINYGTSLYFCLKKL